MAVDLFRQKAITEADMWAVLNFHMRERLKAQGLLDDSEKEKHPRKGHLFTNYADNGRNGLVIWRSADEVGVKYFDTNEYDSLPREDFMTYGYVRGRTNWELF